MVAKQSSTIAPIVEDCLCLIGNIKIQLENCSVKRSLGAKVKLTGLKITILNKFIIDLNQVCKI